MGYNQQQPTVLVCDNSCAVGIANNSLKVKRLKAINMRYHWIKDRIKSKDLQVTWLQGIDNFADFFTKALPVHDHQRIKSRYVQFLLPNPTNLSLSSKPKWKQRISSALRNNYVSKGV